jgi:hypothetical protein
VQASPIAARRRRSERLIELAATGRAAVIGGHDRCRDAVLGSLHLRLWLLCDRVAARRALARLGRLLPFRTRTHRKLGEAVLGARRYQNADET